MNKTYCFTDLHGEWRLWEQIKNYLDDSDIVYCLGDCLDRGSKGLEILEDILADPRVIFIRGNHEDEFLKFFSNPDKYGYYNWELPPDYKKMNKYSFDKKQKLLKRLKNTPVKKVYINKQGQEIHLSHAGFNPNLPYITNDDYLWNRDHIFSSPECFKEDKYKNIYIIHGHTPVISKSHWGLTPLEDLTTGVKIKEYGYGHKFCLDLGSFRSYRAALFNLDTLKVEKYFEDEVKIKNGNRKRNYSF